MTVFILNLNTPFVQGDNGADEHLNFINKVAVHTEINNYATDGTIDHMIFQINYNQLTA